MSTNPHATPPVKTPSPVRDIPQEVLDSFIDEISRLDREDERQQTLQSCQFVSRSFRLRARFHIWSHTKVNLIHDKKRSLMQLERLREAMDSSATLGQVAIGSLIQHLAIEIAPLTSYDTYLILKVAHDLVPILNHTLLYSPGLRSFCFSLSHYYPHWHFLGEPLRSSIDMLSKSVTLENLSIRGVSSIPLSLIDGCKATHLELLQQGFSADQFAEAIAPSQVGWDNSPPPLTHFCTDRFSWLSMRTLRPSMFSNLRNLKLRGSVYSHGLEGIIWEDLGSLQTLAWDIDEDWSSISPTLFPFDQLKNLASLAISQTTTEDYVDHVAGFNNLVNITMILRSPTPSSLKKVSLSFQCRETLPSSSPSDFNLNIIEWNEIDKALTRSQYRSVTEIYIRLDVDLECVEGHDINIDDFFRDHHNLFEQSLMPLTFISFQDAKKGKNLTFEVFTTVTHKRTSLS